MEIPRQNPDQLLSAIKNETKEKNRGHLKIFFGYAAGVGKTYCMLKAAHAAKRRGVDVVAGYIEPHARPKTTALANGLERIPTKEVNYNGIVMQEFDIDAALARKPKLILVDELAHTNAEGSRHAKRYQDVEELLRAGIDVYTTVNVQHIESLNDMVASITRVLVRERIPDSVFDDADQVELVDIEPSDLLERLKEGNVYKKDQAGRAMDNFFTVENLTALREIALRRCADRVNLLTESARIKNQGDYHTDEHVLVCLSTAPSNSKIVRTAARMASAFRGSFTALFVETPDFASMEEEDKKRLRANMHLAEQLGATIETVFGEDVSYQIAEYARLSGVSKIVIGRSNAATRRRLFGKPTLTEKLTAIAPNLDIHIIPDSNNTAVYKKKKKRPIALDFAMPFSDLTKSIGMILLATIIGLIFEAVGFTEANIIAAYILGVFITSVITVNRISSLVASLVSVLVFNFFFTIPKMTFLVYDKNYIVTFIVMFVISFITGALAQRLKQSAKLSAQAAFRTKALFDTNQLLQKAETEEEIIKTTASQLIRLLNRSIMIYPVKGEQLLDPVIFKKQEADHDIILQPEKERVVAEWVLKNNKHAGATTDTLSNATCRYLAVRKNQTVYAVVGIVMEQQPLESFENSVMLSMLGESALAMENLQNAKEKEEAAILAKNEQLRANLLRAISHDLRTPLTSISGNASNLLSNGESFDPEMKRQVYTDIYDDAMWLINLVENLLSVTRLEEGRMNLNMNTELMDEVINEAISHLGRKAEEHSIVVHENEDLLLAKMDGRLMVQVLINIIDNAIKYTPKGSEIVISTKKQDNQILVEIADNGPGIPDEMKPRIFDMFYNGTKKVADSRRSLGLGLSLCKSIVNAHGGEIFVKDNKPVGTVFSFTLPQSFNLGEVEIHE